jgi:hypothetical protein
MSEKEQNYVFIILLLLAIVSGLPLVAGYDTLAIISFIAFFGLTLYDTTKNA